MLERDLERDLLRIGAVQFGRFEVPGAPDTFAPLAVNLRLVPSYPVLLGALAQATAPLVAASGRSHLLPMPSVIPLGTAISLSSGMPLVYPSPDDPEHVEGAYDYHVPTVLLTDALADGSAEERLIAQVRRHGLNVEAVVAVLDFGIRDTLTSAAQPLRPSAWRRLDHLIAVAADNGIITPSMRQTALGWLAALRAAPAVGRSSTAT